jgi:hypothetical protein
MPGREHGRDDRDRPRLRVVADICERRQRRERAVEAVQIVTRRVRIAVVDDAGDHVARQRADQQRACEARAAAENRRDDQHAGRGIALQHDLADASGETAQGGADAGIGVNGDRHAGCGSGGRRVLCRAKAQAATTPCQSGKDKAVRAARAKRP